MGRTVQSYGDSFSCQAWTKSLPSSCNKPCEYLFKPAHVSQGGPLSDEAIGGILVVLSLALLFACLVLMVKLLNSLLQGPMAVAIKKFVNADLPGRWKYFTGYLAMLVGTDNPKKKLSLTSRFFMTYANAVTCFSFAEEGLSPKYQSPLCVFFCVCVFFFNW
jgi:hypothetical protein